MYFKGSNKVRIDQVFSFSPGFYDVSSQCLALIYRIREPMQA